MMSGRGRHLPARRTPTTRPPGKERGAGHDVIDRASMLHRALVRAADEMPWKTSGRQRIMALRGTEGHFFFPSRHGLFEESPREW